MAGAFAATAGTGSCTRVLSLPRGDCDGVGMNGPQWVTWEYDILEVAVAERGELETAGAAGWEAFAVIPIEWGGSTSFDVQRAAIYLRRPT